MDGPVSRTLWKAIAFVWMAIEIGQFIEVRTHLNQNSLFWPLWTCITLLMLLGGYIADGWRRKSKLRRATTRKASSQDK